jgi:tripartite-type tricarboxylate transporter receptor subunit TctC
MATASSSLPWRHLMAAVLSFFITGVAWAQPFPSRPVTLVVPFAAGGATDVVARLLATEVGQHIGQSVVVENKPGAAGSLGANFVAKSPPDGYTVCLCGAGPMVMLALLDPKLPYVPTRDLAPVILSHLVDFVVVVKADAPYATLPELVAAAKTQPGRIAYGTPGIGGPAHLGMELFARISGTSYLHVPYRGESQIGPELIGGQIQVGLLSVQAAQPLIAAGKVRPLAVWSPQRVKALPTVPTVAEQGYPGYFAGTFVGINVAAGTPSPVVDRLHAAFDAALKKPAVRGKLEELGFTPMGLAPAAYAAFLHREQVKWAKVISDAGITGRE